MGGNSSKTVARQLSKPIKNYNVENRAQKVVEDHKVNPKVAPYYPSTSDHIEKAIADSPEIKEELDKKDTKTIERMSRLHIETMGKKPDLKRKELPQNRKQINPYFDMESPEAIPKGQVSLQKIGRILDVYKTDPNIQTVKKVSTDYHIDLSTAGFLLKYYEKVDFGDKILTDNTSIKLKEKFVQLRKFKLGDIKIDSNSKLTDTKPAVDGKS